MALTRLWNNSQAKLTLLIRKFKTSLRFYHPSLFVRPTMSAAVRQLALTGFWRVYRLCNCSYNCSVIAFSSSVHYSFLKILLNYLMQERNANMLALSSLLYLQETFFFSLSGVSVRWKLWELFAHPSLQTRPNVSNRITSMQNCCPSSWQLFLSTQKAVALPGEQASHPKDN